MTGLLQQRISLLASLFQAVGVISVIGQLLTAQASLPDDNPQPIQRIQSALNGGKIDEARRLLEKVDSLKSLECRYLQARLKHGKEGTPAPDLIQQVTKPDGVEVRYAILHPSKREIVFICRDGGLRIVDLMQPAAEPTLVADEDRSAIYRGKFSADGKRFLSGHQNGKVLVRNTSNWQLLTTAAVGTDWPVRELAVGPDGTMFVAESKEGLELWSLADDAPKKIARLADRLNFGEGVCFSPHGDRIATGGMFDINLHDAKTGDTVHSMRHASYTMGLEFSPDGSHIASAPRGNVNKILAVFDVTQTKPLFNAGPFGNYVVGLAFTPDGKRILATGCEKQVRVFDAVTGDVVLSIVREECSTEPGVIKDGSLFGWSEPSGFMYIDLSN